MRGLLERILPKKKPAWAALCQVKYIDKQKRKYYQYTDEFDMPLVRKGWIDKLIMELRYGSDYDYVIEKLKESLNAHEKKGVMAPDIQTAGYLVQELIDRKKMLLIPDVLFEVLCVTLIREDENPELEDHEIEQEKIATFKKEIKQGGLFPFFQSGGILKLFGLPNCSITEFNRRISDSIAHMERFQMILSPRISEPTSLHGFRTG